jgi:mono/diheme cytochrome c family protein
MRYWPALVFTTVAWTQNSKTVLDGVYSEAQATRGAAVFAITCTRCHGENLQGKSDPALRGNGFVERWREDPLDVLFTFVSTRMPPRGAGRDAAGGLPRTTYLDLVAFILQANEYPSGPADLTEETAKQILLVGKDGPRPLSTNALVGSVGCLASAPGNNWVLNNATEPFRVRVADETDPEELHRASARPAGNATVRLQNVTFFRPDFKPESLAGQRVQAKGALIRQANNIRINVLSLEPVGATCALQ